ncbi:MAG: DUF1648 domain-containing protein [Bacteroidales bacterium]|nr:DUF1648 domain-containing protein [Bacteroidales bacterium]
MNKRGWLIPILIITLNVLAIILRWGSMSEILPAHFDLEGNAGGTMPRTTLLFYPLIVAVVCLIGYFIARAKGKLGTGMIILTAESQATPSPFCLVCAAKHSCPFPTSSIDSLVARQSINKL